MVGEVGEDAAGVYRIVFLIGRNFRRLDCTHLTCIWDDSTRCLYESLGVVRAADDHPLTLHEE